MTVIGIVTEKGGVGKTTSVVSLAVALAQREKKVIVVDLDSQAHAGKALGAPRDSGPDVGEILWNDLPAHEAVRETRVPGLKVIGGSKVMGEFDIDVAAQLSGAQQRTLIKRQVIDPVKSDFDAVLIDCPPGIGLIHLGVYEAADWVLIPIEPEADAVEGMLETRAHLAAARDRYGCETKLLGVLPTRVEGHTREHRDNLLELREELGDEMLTTVVRKTTRVREAARMRKSILEFAPESTAAQDYRAAADEILERIRAEG